MGRLDDAGRKKLSDYAEARKALNNDQKSFLKTTSPELNDQYELFKKEYRENVVPYNSTDTTRKMIKGETSGITPSEISRCFRFSR